VTSRDVNAGSRGLPVRLAVAQLPVDPASVDNNVAAAVRAIEAAASADDVLLVFPECFLSGYIVDNGVEAAARSISATDPRIGRLADACRSAGVHAVVGYLESQDAAVYNSAVLLGPTGVLGNYRKQHLPHLGVDRFVTPGERGPLVVHTRFGRVGVMICFDLRFPEVARGLALRGADVIAMPTNWPDDVSFLAEHMAPVRAVENQVYLAVADRPDSERGVGFFGGSRVITPSGDVVARGRGSGVFTADVDLEVARGKHLVKEPGVYELSLFDGRRPENYTDLVAPAGPSVVWRPDR
jgi:predicted amidohydrolase